MTETNKQTYTEQKETICVIDGIKFEEPKNFEDYMAVGIYGLLLIITFPVWIIPYLFGRAFKKVAKKETRTYRRPICQKCNNPMEWNSYWNEYKCDCQRSYY